jgi:epoxide hydrolase 4
MPAAPADAGMLGGDDAATGPAASALACPSAAPATSRVHVGELSLNVACQGSGTTLVMLHGYPGFHLTWARFMQPLASLGYRVIAPDLRGYNLSDRPREVDAYQLDHLVADVAGLVDASGSASVVLVGHDWGGTVAYAYAHRHPERVRGLVVLAAPHPDVWGHPEIDAEQARAADAYVPFVAGPMGELAFARFDAALSPYLSPAELAQYHAAWEQPGAKVAMNDWYRANLHPEVKLPTGVTVSARTLAVWGLKDTFVTPSQLMHLPRYVSDLKIVTYPDGDHWLPLQMPDALIELIAQFEAALPR